ncbi:MAG: hypothetical protein MRY83_10975 [Flavobacteriales bacterium]|nr:hypothetical protein [Flavobacteriales bacterium]
MTINKFPFAIALFLLIILSCNSNKKPSAKMADEYCENYMLRMSMCENVYKSFIALIPEKHDIASNIGINAAYDVMVKTFDEEFQKCENMEVWDVSEQYIESGKRIKSSTIEILTVYREEGQGNILKAKQLINQGHTNSSVQVDSLLSIFENRLNNAYKAFGEEQERFANEFGITLY